MIRYFAAFQQAFSKVVNSNLTFFLQLSNSGQKNGFINIESLTRQIGDIFGREIDFVNEVKKLNLMQYC